MRSVPRGRCVSTPTRPRPVPVGQTRRRNRRRGRTTRFGHLPLPGVHAGRYPELVGTHGHGRQATIADASLPPAWRPVGSTVATAPRRDRPALESIRFGVDREIPAIDPIPQGRGEGASVLGRMVSITTLPVRGRVRDPSTGRVPPPLLVEPDVRPSRIRPSVAITLSTANMLPEAENLRQGHDPRSRHGDASVTPWYRSNRSRRMNREAGGEDASIRREVDLHHPADPRHRRAGRQEQRG